MRAVLVHYNVCVTRRRLTRWRAGASWRWRPLGARGPAGGDRNAAGGAGTPYPATGDADRCEGGRGPGLPAVGMCRLRTANRFAPDRRRPLRRRCVTGVRAPLSRYRASDRLFLIASLFTPALPCEGACTVGLVRPEGICFARRKSTYRDLPTSVVSCGVPRATVRGWLLSEPASRREANPCACFSVKYISIKTKYRKSSLWCSTAHSFSCSWFVAASPLDSLAQPLPDRDPLALNHINKEMIKHETLETHETQHCCSCLGLQTPSRSAV